MERNTLRNTIASCLLISLLTLSGAALAEFRNGTFPVTGQVAARRGSLCQFSIAYSSGESLTTYGPAFGCQWGDGLAFTLDASVAPGHHTDSDEGDENISFGITGHLGLGMAGSLLDIRSDSGFGFGWSLNGKVLGGISYVGSPGLGMELGGAFGTSFEFSHPIPFLNRYLLVWGPYVQYMVLMGDMAGGTSFSPDASLVNLGVSLALERGGKPSALFGTYGAVVGGRDLRVSWFSVGVRF